MPRLTRRKLLTAATMAAAAESTACRKLSPTDSQSKAERFSSKLWDDLAAAGLAPLSYIGDRLGIFKAMSGAGPLTAAELAKRTGLNHRYIRAWLEAMTAAEYIEYQPAGKRFLLPPEHAAVLADEESPHF